MVHDVHDIPLKNLDTDALYGPRMCFRSYWYQDSLDQCPMPINADQNHGIDQKFLSTLLLVYTCNIFLAPKKLNTVVIIQILFYPDMLRRQKMKKYRFDLIPMPLLLSGVMPNLNTIRYLSIFFSRELACKAQCTSLPIQVPHYTQNPHC